MAFVSQQIAPDRHSPPGRHAGRTVTGAERIVRAFRAFGKAGQTVPLAQGVDTLAPPCQDLVRIALVADLPDQAIFRRFEHRMQGNGQLHHPQSRPQMTARRGNRADGLGTQLLGKLLKLAGGEVAQVRR